MSAEKKALRQVVRARFPGEAARAEASAALCRQIQASIWWQQAQTVAAYMPLPWEADITPLLTAALADRKTLLLPRVAARDLLFLQVSSLNDLHRGIYGIPEPDETCPAANIAKTDLMLVPLEAIDNHGLRLGKGGGYYDRLLTAFPSLMTLACPLPWQWAEVVPSDPWDQPVRAAVRGDGIIQF